MRAHLPRADRAHATALVVAGAALVLAGVGCSGVTRARPAEGIPHPRAAYVPVAYPPPPARVEFVPASPSPDAVWVDGEWDFQFGRWHWTYGAWVVPEPGTTHSRWVLVRDRRGELWFAPAAWRDANARPCDPPRPLRRGVANERMVREEDGTDQPVGPNALPPPMPPADDQGS